MWTGRKFEFQAFFLHFISNFHVVFVLMCENVATRKKRFPVISGKTRLAENGR